MTTAESEKIREEFRKENEINTAKVMDAVLQHYSKYLNKTPRILNFTLYKNLVFQLHFPQFPPNRFHNSEQFIPVSENFLNEVSLKYSISEKDFGYPMDVQNLLPEYQENAIGVLSPEYCKVVDSIEELQMLSKKEVCWINLTQESLLLIQLKSLYLSNYMLFMAFM